ncbi:MAG TPA: FAD-binding oxidoreductase, partial [Burkholderiales bacterium]|nr:FAD-binding oxidoreductase [Burkholderiales bacterium]
MAARLRKEIDAEVMFDAASRGRYSTDASIYQVEPIGVVVPRSEEAARAAIAIAVEQGVPILPRGAGSSQCGQAVGAALVIDHTKYLNKILEIRESRAVVQPGVVLDQLNAALRKHGVWFPVDVSTSAQATLGGMTGNNSCGSRSIEYGNMVHNVLAIEAVTATGSRWRFADMNNPSGPADYLQFIGRLKALYEREKREIELRFPKVLRKVAGYNLDHLGPPHANAAHLLVGSEGTLAYSERIHLKLSPLPAKRSLGVCHFPKFYTAMDLTQQIVKLEPTAVELVDRTMLGLARENPAFEKTVNAFIKGDPDAILLVEFADERVGRLKDLVQLMAD